MNPDECASYILTAVEKRKRTLVITRQGKETVLLNRLLPSFTDKMVHKFFFKDGVLIK